MNGILTTEHGSQLHYVQQQGKRLLHVLFVHGFRSDKNGGKALALQQWCGAHDLSFTRFDLSGHGDSSLTLAECSMSLWRKDCLAMIDSLPQNHDVLVVGSSLGGWLMLLAALARPQKVKGLLGIAAASDCIKELLYDKLPAADKDALKQGKTLMIEPSHPDDDPYPITQKLIDDSAQYHLLHDTIAITCPVRLLHGTHDDSVPPHYSERLLAALASENAALTLIKNGDHRLSAPAHLEHITHALESLIKAVKPSL